MLIIDKVSFNRNQKELFKNICQELHPGDLLQVSGENGSGKSTLLRILAGLIEPEYGSVTWLNHSIYHHENYQQQLHYIGHQNGVNSYLTVYQNLKFYFSLKKINSCENKIKITTQQMGIHHLIDKQALHLSAGQLRKLALSRLQLYPAKIWILDEPTTSLDDEGQQLFLKLLSTHLENNGIAIIATHEKLKIKENIKCLVL